MRLARLISIMVLFAGVTAHAQFRGPGSEIFDLVVSSVDPQTAAELTASKDAIEVIRDDLVALRDTDDPDQDLVDALRDELMTSRQALREQVRAIVEADEDLQAELRALAEEARGARFARGFGPRDEEVFNEIVAVATPEQADTLETNRAALESLREDLRSAREAGATRDDVSDLRAAMRELMDEQRSLIFEIVEENQDALSGVLEDARATRERVFDGRRDFGRPRRPGRRD